MDLEANQPGILATVAYNGRNVKLEEWAGVDSQRTLTLRHDESFKAQKRQRLGRTERQRDTSRHQAPVHDVSKALLTGYYTPSHTFVLGDQ